MLKHLSTQQEKNENTIFILVLFVLSLLSVFFYFPEYHLYPGLDAYFHYNRISILMESINDGTFPVYLDSAGANGYGYGTPLFFSDFTLIPIALLASITNIVIAHKILIFSLSFFSGYFTSIVASRVSGSRFVGYVTAILIAFSYYRLWGISHRTNIGEAFSFVFIPIVIWGLHEIISGQYKRWYILAIGFSLLVLNHLLTSVLTGVVLLPIVLLNIKQLCSDKNRIFAFSKAVVITLLLSAYSTLPLIEQSLSNRFDLEYMVKFINPALTKLDYVSFAKGFFAGFFFEGIDEDVFPSTQGAGLILTVLILLRVFIRDKNKLLRIADICTIYGFILIIATCKIFPWGRFPFTLLNVIQFPWRLAEFTTIFWAFSGAIYVSILANTHLKRIKTSIFIILASIVLIGINSYNYRNFYTFDTMSPTPSRENCYHIGNFEYVPLNYVLNTEYFMDKIAERKEGIVTQNIETETSNYSHIKSNIKFEIDTKNIQDSLIVPLFYYKGYQATFNEKEIPITQSKTGQLQLAVEGKGLISVDFPGTLIQKYSFYITLFSFCLLSLYIVLQRRKQDK